MIPPSNNITFTNQGLLKFRLILRRSRGSRSYKTFAYLTGVSPAALYKLEKSNIKEVKLNTLVALAPHMMFDADFNVLSNDEAFEHLLKICMSENTDIKTANFAKAEDFFELVDLLSDQEAAKLGQYLLQRWAGKIRS